MDIDEYDEFGNLIDHTGTGTDAESSSLSSDVLDRSQSTSSDLESEVEDQDDQDDHRQTDEMSPTITSSSGLEDSRQIVKLTLETAFQGAETIVINQDTEMADQPVLAPKKAPRPVPPSAGFHNSYFSQMALKVPLRLQNVAFVGSLASGKTSVVQLMSETDETSAYTAPSHPLEVLRQMSIFTNYSCSLAPNSQGKSSLVNALDTPGHPNFFGEVMCSLEAADLVVFVVDVIEGMTNTDKKTLNEVAKKNLPIVLVLSKLDRLIFELRIPPSDAFHKIRHVIEEINQYLSIIPISIARPQKILMNKVVFASAKLGFFFTLESIENLYKFTENDLLDMEFYQLDEEYPLWGDVYYDKNSNTFQNHSNNTQWSRSFVLFVLEPLYKLALNVVTADSEGSSLKLLLWDQFKVRLPNKIYHDDTHVVLRLVFLAVYGKSALADVFVDVNSEKSVDINLEVTEEEFTGRAFKILEHQGANYTLVRVYSGMLKKKAKVKVIVGSDEEQQRICVVGDILLFNGESVDQLGPNSMGLVQGIDEIIEAGARLASSKSKSSNVAPHEISYTDWSVFKIAIEPVKPLELPLLVERLRHLNKVYLSVALKVEDSGEHVIFGPGELYLDCFLHDLRATGLKIRVLDPLVRLGETVVANLSAKISVASQLQENNIAISAEPAELNITEAIQNGEIDISQARQTAKKLRSLGWDALAARSLWGFSNSNLIVHDILEPSEDIVDIKKDIIQGFQWASKEGPLCDEPLHQTKFRIIDAAVAGTGIQRSGTQVIPMVRRACYSAFMTAEPRLVEPVYAVYVTCRYKAIGAVSKLLSKRRGGVVSTEAIAATQLHRVTGYVPVIESVGLETDVRLRTDGQAMCFLEFDKWDLVPGDPLDGTVELPSLEPVPLELIARDFVLKTRKRKGLVGEPSLKKYVGLELYEKLLSNGLVRDV